MRNKYLKSDYNKLLELLYQARSAQGLRQSDLADLMNVPQSYISKIESGERKIDIMAFIELCESMNVNPVEMFTKFMEKLNETQSRIHKPKQ